ncbi:hypothetical protein ACLKA7_015320 [Drosophila subpalustris]
MTVTYTSRVTTSRRVSNFLRLLARWRGSVYKLIWMNLLLFLLMYIFLAISYRYLMNEPARKVFEDIVVCCHKYANIIPVSFVLGFFVSIVMGRWWKQYLSIPWPDSIALLVSSSIHGADDRARAMRRTIMRYVCLCQVIVFTMISPSVKKRFPTYNQIIEAGLLLENEKIIIETLDVAFPYYPKHWMPIVWAASLVNRARRENKIRDDYAVKSIIDELNSFRGLCGFLLYYDWVSIPLVYTQVVTLATYSFFLVSVIGQQWIASPHSSTSDNVIFRYFPILTILQFFFYMGWLKVAESLINPFGEDDDDFELNWIIDRNLTVSYLIVDDMHQEHPQLIKDQYWDEIFPNELPYTDESKRPVPPEPSTAKLGISRHSLDENKTLLKTNLLMMESTHSFISRSTSDPYAEEKDQVRSSAVTFNDNTMPSDSDRRIGSEINILQPSPTSMNLEELIDQRNRERRERLRNRFLDMRSSHRPMNSQYILTVLRPPSAGSSHHTMVEEGEEEQEEKTPTSDVPNNKQEKTD